MPLVPGEDCACAEVASRLLMGQDRNMLESDDVIFDAQVTSNASMRGGLKPSSRNSEAAHLAQDILLRALLTVFALLKKRARNFLVLTF